MKNARQVLRVTRWPLLFAAAAVAGIGLYALAFGASGSEPEPEAATVNSLSAESTANLSDAVEEALVQQVTFEELEAAKADYIACLERYGWEWVGLPSEGLRPTQMMFHGPGANGRPPEVLIVQMRATEVSCRAEVNLDDIETNYLLSVPPPTDAEIAALFQAMRDCIAEGGRPEQELPGVVTGVGYPTTEGIEITPEQETAFAQCGYALWAETGLAAPTGGGMPPDLGGIYD